MAAANPYIFLPLATINDRLTMYLAAEVAILNGAQSYSMNGVSLTRANLAEIKNSIFQLSQAAAKKSGASNTVAQPIVHRRGYGC